MDLSIENHAKRKQGREAVPPPLVESRKATLDPTPRRPNNARPDRRQRNPEAPRWSNPNPGDFHRPVPGRPRVRGPPVVAAERSLTFRCCMQRRRWRPRMAFLWFPTWHRGHAVDRRVPIVDRRSSDHFYTVAGSAPRTIEPFSSTTVSTAEGFLAVTVGACDVRVSQCMDFSLTSSATRIRAPWAIYRKYVIILFKNVL